jgi:GTPase involved in cell partitioning and DNA repair
MGIFVTLKNPSNVGAKIFALKEEWKHQAVYCDSGHCPCFDGGDAGTGADIAVNAHCNTNTDNVTTFGSAYTNDTGVDGNRVFMNSPNFKVKEIEVFEITA